MRCSFSVICVDKDKVYLQDLGGRVSITNDAEAVLEWFKQTHPGHRLFYKDTYGELTEIVDEPHTTWMGTRPITFRTVQA